MYKVLYKIRISFLSNFRIEFQNSGCLSPISLHPSSSKTLASYTKLEYRVHEFEGCKPTISTKEDDQFGMQFDKLSNGVQSLDKITARESRDFRILHPWPEWMELMEHLLKKGYFEGQDCPLRNRELSSKESNQIRTACLNFARDRFYLVSYLPRKDIQVLVQLGCPSTDRKVVNSGKRLRAHVGIDEGNVCSSCRLRGQCERAYVKASEDAGGRNVDVMRILLTYALDPITGSVENKLCQNEVVEESVRKLLNEIVQFSINEAYSEPWKEKSIPLPQGKSEAPIKQGDWLCPKCSFLNFARNIKCLRCNGLFQERLRKLGEDQDHLPLKKGDWLCDKCKFLNFAKNAKCLQCSEKPPKRQLNPGEWECDSCNYINFRRNIMCLRCDYRRPKGSTYCESSSQLDDDSRSFRQLDGTNFVRHARNSRSSDRLDRQNRRIVSNMWRFIEDESKDGAELNLENQSSVFVDFPIAGGKSSLSQNAERRERWKLEMLERSRTTFREKKNNADCRSQSSKEQEVGLFECTDDQEIEEWFGSGIRTG